MLEKIHIRVSAIKENELLLLPEKVVNIKGMRPKEQVLVDSDDASFIYLLENDEYYTYIV